MSGRFTFYCSPQEFAERLGRALIDCGLVAFKRHQATDEVIPLEKAAFSSPDLMLEWQWDLWLAKHVPRSKCPEIPARAGWISVEPPRVNSEKKTIESSSVSVRTDWVEQGTDVVFENPELQELYKEVKKRFVKGVQRGPAIWLDLKPERPDRAYYTQQALELQKGGWHFRDIGNGAIQLGGDGLPSG